MATKKTTSKSVTNNETLLNAVANLADLPPTSVSPQTLMERHAKRKKATAKREREINPNRDSDTKVEIYILGLSNQKLVEGQPAHFHVVSIPSVIFRPKELRINVTKPGILFIKNILVANINACIGGGFGVQTIDGNNFLQDHWTDAYDYHASCTAIPFDLPTMSPANRMMVEYFYTGEFFQEGKKEWRLTTTFKGPATLTA